MSPLGYIRRRHATAAVDGLTAALADAHAVASLLGGALLHHDDWCGHNPQAPGHPSYHEAIEAWQHWLAFGRLPTPTPTPADLVAEAQADSWSDEHPDV